VYLHLLYLRDHLMNYLDQMEYRFLLCLLGYTNRLRQATLRSTKEKDWLTQVEAIMADMSDSSRTWFSLVMKEVDTAYTAYLKAPPMDRLTLRPTEPENLVSGEVRVGGDEKDVGDQYVVSPGGVVSAGWRAGGYCNDGVYGTIDFFYYVGVTAARRTSRDQARDKDEINQANPVMVTLAGDEGKLLHQ
ncbi:GIP, partial [Symbiodinium necroappetens]